ncbi:Alkaline phosphatase synthesis sensor protein PhoR [Roseovarius litorisediminis]|uniref:histidine kinase n=1 Tax=Roseovarius litorisediminis TaxID=1312363 RepID=A0A1Y5R9R0_9RHOB|nr:ATP-binding protein [Roseovarius litorisediminis]SLN12344.1 Alkaline phosphatase synthesis sensor protein PhoR [Roseovarius litorisediminis]
MEPSQVQPLLQAFPLPVLLIGPDELILGANDPAQAFLGKGLTGRHFIAALRQPTVLDAVEACLRKGTPGKTRYLGSDGAQDTSFDVTCTSVPTAAGPGVLVSFEDTTHLQQADQMRRDFVANVSHELRTPLTSLMGFIETLRGPARNDPVAIDRFLGIMQSESARMERLVRDLLSLSRVEGQERVRPTETVEIGQCLQSVVHALRPVATDKDVTIDLVLPETGLTVNGASDQLVQVFTNLIENAVNYGGAGNSVEVAAHVSENAPSVRGPAVIVTVTDQGPGIDQVHIPRLTERFYRVDSHRSREMGGTGLGLAIVKHIINRHRGRLRISSELGKGSEFRVILPRETRG